MNGTDDGRAARADDAPSSRSRWQADRPIPVVAIAALVGVGVLLPSGPLVADEPVGSTAAPEPAAASPPIGGGMIPRDAIIDMTRAQSGVICSSEIFLGCMGFDGTMCLSLSEAAIERCLVPLPAEIDPAALDNATLEACPKTVYAEAGYDETKADACFLRALEES